MNNTHLCKYNNDSARNDNGTIEQNNLYVVVENKLIMKSIISNSQISPKFEYLIYYDKVLYDWSSTWEYKHSNSVNVVAAMLNVVQSTRCNLISTKMSVCEPPK